MRVNLAHLEPRSRVHGPGARAVLWVQGCPLRCAGCLNPEILPVRDAHWIGVALLAEYVTGPPGIEGVIFSGGAPTAQAGALAELASRVRTDGPSVVSDTGFTLGELRPRGARSWIGCWGRSTPIQAFHRAPARLQPPQSPEKPGGGYKKPRKREKNRGR